MKAKRPEAGSLVACVLVALGLVACDPGDTRGGDIDPDDPGSDKDVGAGDLGPTPVEQHGKLDVVGVDLHDAHGARMQLKGVSSMWLNWENDGYAEDPTALRWMRNNWHLSVIRASMGVEPSGAYLSNPAGATAQVEKIVANAIAAGVYVIIDWHDHNAQMHQAQAVEFFTAMAEKYAGVPNVLYEPFNEPQAVDWGSVVKPYHQAVVDAIRAVDPAGIIVLGTPNWSQDVDVAAGDPVSGTNLVYTLHFYSCTHTSWLRDKGESARLQGAALFVSEWGASAADGGTNGDVCLEEASTWHEWMDGYGIGWTAWKLDNCAQDSTCLLAPDAPLAGGWTSKYLHGHGVFVRARMQE